MGFTVGPSIVSSGLVLALDAGDKLSYSGNGQGTSTWYDLSGNNKHFTVTIEALATAWNSAGYFELNDSRTFTCNTAVSNATACTAVFWLRTTDDKALFVQGDAANLFEFVAAYQGDYLSGALYSNLSGTPTYSIDLTTAVYPNRDGNWHMWEFKNIDMSGYQRFHFNNYANYTFGNGALASILVYNRNLTTAESAQNYNAMRRRFNI